MVRLVLGGESGDRSRRRIAHRRAAKPLFLRAQAAGEASADLAFIDVPRLVGAIAVAAEHDPATADRLLAIAGHGFLSPGDKGASGVRKTGS